ncbi:MAG: lipopolysaccharide kinase InaA family protein [Pseudomonadota bacterium]
MNTVRMTSLKGDEILVDTEKRKSGAVKDIYFHPDRRYVVGFYREVDDYPALRDRLVEITGRYRENLFDQDHGDYWKPYFAWPQDVVEYNGGIGVVVPFYDSAYFFEHGSVDNDKLNIRGEEKEGKWFTSALHRTKFLDPREIGTWLSYLQICLRIARAVRRLHMAGLAHSDLSYKNVLVDPTTSKVCLIDLDGLVVPGKYPPDVVGTPDFIAPEVVAGQHLGRDDPGRVLPSQATDRHALAVLIYMYLFCRHPLKGGKVHAPDPDIDSALEMGRDALFIEHPDDTSNRVRSDELSSSVLPWGDPEQRPYTMAGPHLRRLFERAFIDGLHDPARRPSPSDWESALLRTLDMIQPCPKPCAMAWYVFDDTRAPVCPHCGTPHQGTLPVLSLYSSRVAGQFHPDQAQIMVWDGQSLFPWHTNRKIFPNEHLKPADQRRVGYFQRHGGEWYLVNERLPSMKIEATDDVVPPGGRVKLEDGLRVLLSSDDGGRLFQVQMAGN